MKTTRAQTGNVFLAYKSVNAIDDLIESWKRDHSPLYNFTATDGIGHTVWVVEDEGTIQAIGGLFASEVPFTYIADGHHRAASAAKVRKALGAAATEASNYFLTTLFPSDQLHILDYNRLVHDLNGHSVEEIVDNLQKEFFVGKVGQAFSPGRLHEFGMYVDGSWYKLVAKEGSFSTDPIGILDVTILQKNILEKYLGIRIRGRTSGSILWVASAGLPNWKNGVNSGEMKSGL